MDPAWHFVKHQPGQLVVNPLGGEHFAEADEDWRPGEVLVRECIQNSLDARHDAEVSVCFQVRSLHPMSDHTASYWLTSLWPHLRSRECRLTDIPDAPRPGGVVVVEDFGTRGLEGDVREGTLPLTDNRFFNFFRADGLSGNPMNGTAGGSWGVGKSVFNRCSAINAFLALTGRRHERDVALIGRAVLWHHRCQNCEYQAIGQFGSKQQGSDFMVLPATNDSIVRRFVKDFGLLRSLDGAAPEPGLSVVIPYAHKEITADGIVDIVIREYFHPILAGRLRVRVSGTFGGKQDSVELDQDTLIGRASHLKRPEIARVLDLARWSLDDGPRHAFRLHEPPPEEAPEWNDELLRMQDPGFSELCQRFERGEPVSISVGVWVARSGQRAERDRFLVYLQRDLSGSGYRPVFVRGCIVVPNARQRAVRNQNLFSLVIIGDGPLAVMLRAAEPPAHTNWSPDTANFKGRYAFGRQTIDFVVGAPKYLADALSNARTGRDLDIWADLFPSPDTAGERPADGAGRKGHRRPLGPTEPPQARPKPFKIDETVGGFTVTRDNSSTTSLPGRIEVRVAYDTSRGNPFKKYHAADFSISDLIKDATHTSDLRCSANSATFTPTSDAFRFEVVGADVNRDLVVRVRASAAGEEGEE